MGIYVWSGLYSFLANILIGLFVFSRDPKKPVNILFALFSLGISCWSVGSFLENIIPDKELALGILRLNYLFGVWVPPLYLHFIYALAGDVGLHERLKLQFSYAGSLLLTLFVFTPWFIPRLRVIEGTSFYITQPGPVYYFFFFFFSLCMLEILRYTFLQMGAKKGLHRYAFRYVALANCLAVFAGFEYFSKAMGLLPGPPFDDYLLVIYVLVLAFAIARHGLFDIHQVAAAFQRHSLASLGMLAACINHEIKNPLYIVKGNLDVALDALKQGDPGKAEETLAKTYGQIDRAFKVIQLYNRFAKPDTAHEDKVATACVRTAVDSVLEFVDFERAQRSVAVIKNLEPEIPRVKCSQWALENILFNLLFNAMQAMAINKKGTIEIEAKRKEEKVQVIVKDNGCGMAKEQLKQIFVPFYSGGKREGVGLGLYFCREMLAKYGAQIEIQSEIDRGTQALISLQPVFSVA